MFPLETKTIHIETKTKELTRSHFVTSKFNFSWEELCSSRRKGIPPQNVSQIGYAVLLSDIKMIKAVPIERLQSFNLVFVHYQHKQALK